MQPHPAAIPVTQTVLDVDIPQVARDNAVVVRLYARQVFLVDTIHPGRHRHREFPGGIPQQGQVTVIDLGAAARQVRIVGAQAGTDQRQFKLFMSFRQLCLDAPAVGDVLETGERTDKLAFDPQRTGMDPEPAPFSSGPSRYAHDHIPDRYPRFQADHRRVLLAGKWAAIGTHCPPVQIHGRLAGDLGKAQPENFRRRFVCGNDAAGRVIDDNRLQQGIEQGREQGLIQHVRSIGRAFHEDGRVGG